jgi:lysyl-tRNA synthetase, class II
MSNPLRDDRLKKLARLREAGVNPWGHRLDNRAMISEALAKFPKQPPVVDESAAATEPPEYGAALIAGRVMLVRDFGSLIFLTVRDQTGEIQIALTKKILGAETLKLAQKALDLWDIVAAEGTLRFTKKGEQTLWAKSFEWMCKSISPLPAGKTEKHALADVELRHRRRYVDMASHPEVRAVFEKRSLIMAEVRRFMEARGFIEVETPMMQPIPGGATAKPFITHHNALDMDLYLRIAPELYLKRLLVGGMERVFEINRNFRNEGLSPRHNPEFTMMEAYMAYGDLRSMMDITENVFADLARKVAGGTKVPFKGETIDLTPPWPRLEFLPLLAEKTGVDPADLNALRAWAVKRGVAEADTLDRVGLLDEAFSLAVEPNLRDACFIIGQPAEMSPLCRRRTDAPELADRFEAYIAGMEIANAYTELNDPIEQRENFLEQADGDAGALDEDFIEALEVGMPPAGGLGIGIDRMCMVLTDSPTIRDVILFPLLRKEEAGEEQSEPKQ